MIRLITDNGEAWCYGNDEQVMSCWSESDLPEERRADEIQSDMYFHDSSNDPADRYKWRKEAQGGARRRKSKR